MPNQVTGLLGLAALDGLIEFIVGIVSISNVGAIDLIYGLAWLGTEYGFWTRYKIAFSLARILAVIGLIISLLNTFVSVVGGILFILSYIVILYLTANPLVKNWANR